MTEFFAKCNCEKHLHIVLSNLLKVQKRSHSPFVSLRAQSHKILSFQGRDHFLLQQHSNFPLHLCFTLCLLQL